MPGHGTTKDEKHPHHPSLPRRGGGVKGRDIFMETAMPLKAIAKDGDSQ